MANTVYIIVNTAGQPVAAIQPNTLNGPGGVQQSSDLSMFGLGYALWGQASDQNDYRLVENFACPESGVTPGTPANAAELGAGNGINEPLVGQLWFNTTDQSMYVCKQTNPAIEWEPVATPISVGPTQPSPADEGQLWYDNSVSLTTPQLKVYNGSSFVSVAERYLPLIGGTVSGALTVNGGISTNATPPISNVIRTGNVRAASYRAQDGNTTNQIFIPDGGGTAIGNGPQIGTNYILHTGNIGTVGLFKVGMIMMYYQLITYSPSGPTPGWAPCDGGTYNGTPTPDMRGVFPIGAGGAYSYNQPVGSLTLNFQTNTIGSHNHTGFVSDTTLNVTQIPSHVHPMRVCTNGGGDTHNFQGASGFAGDSDSQAYWTKNSNNAGSDLMQGAGGGLPHNHTVSSDGSHFHSVPGTWTTSNLPPSRGVFFIMYVG